MCSQNKFDYISLHINLTLDWKEIRKILDKWVKQFEIDLSEKILLFYLMDFYDCQKYGQPSELIKYVNSLGGGQSNYYKEHTKKFERLKELFENLNHHKGLALFIGYLNDELKEERDMAIQYPNVKTILIGGDKYDGKRL